LREFGFSAYGVDIDDVVLRNGYELLKGRGYDPTLVLRNVTGTANFETDFFKLIFSEETLEHVGPLDQVAREMYRLTAPGGIGIHCFPGSKKLIEPHLHMPLVHWLPKTGEWQRASIALSVLLGIVPKSDWPETAGGGIWRKIRVYANYLKHKTYHRDIFDVAEVFGQAGFDCDFFATNSGRRWNRFIPHYLKRNGFPSGSIILLLRKDASQMITDSSA
jgi:SAM-dependent methyltransferase